MAQWKNVKKTYQVQQQIWIKVPKNADDFKEENIKTKFENIDCFEFLFQQFNKEQILDLVINNGETEKETVKKQFGKFIDNIIDWKNIKVKDILKDDNEELLDFDKEAIDEFFAVNFWVIQFFIHQVNESVSERKNILTTQKKT